MLTNNNNILFAGNLSKCIHVYTGGCWYERGRGSLL